MAKTEGFWDSSALVPLCTEQRASSFVRAELKKTAIAVWWAAPVEITSAFSRLLTMGAMDQVGFDRAMGRLAWLRRTWIEIAPSEKIREVAEASARRHLLRAADAFQLAAALEWCRSHPRGRAFVCLDRGLCGAARAEGFQVETA